MTTSTIPTSAKIKEIVLHGPSTLCVMWAHRGTDLVKTAVPTGSHRACDGENSRRPCWFVRGRRWHWRCR
jgi:hypothetical protein